nr:immunoglobulin light chain junction region [Mus musculus]
CHQYWSTPWTF